MTIARRDWIDSSDTDPETREHKNDIWVSDGGLAMCEGKDEYAQTIEAVIKTVYGEIQVNREYGIPYFTTIWNNSRGADAWAIAVREAVQELPFVDNIISLDYKLDGQSNIFHYELTVQTTDAGVVTVAS